ncbi:MAG: hypothetical protein ACERKZ_09950 [Lachnotalea sp.]
MDEKDMIDDIVAMLDRSVKNGVGHLNVSTVESLDETKTIEQLGCLDCAKGDLACNVPTLHEGIDDDE